MIIIASTEKLQIGIIRNGGCLTDAEGKSHPDMPIFVMREATEEEYINFSKHDPAFKYYAQTKHLFPYFYEISID